MRESLGHIEAVDRDSDHLASLVVNSEHEDSTVRIRKRRQLVGHILTVRPLHLVTRKHDGLQLQRAIFAETDLLQELCHCVKHGCAPCLLYTSEAADE